MAAKIPGVNTAATKLTDDQIREKIHMRRRAKPPVNKARDAKTRGCRDKRHWS